MPRPRLLCLTHAFPPGVSQLFPEKQPAGHLIETSLIQSLGAGFEVRSVGVSDVDTRRLPKQSGESPGLPHVLNLIEKSPEVFHRWNSLRRLCRAYHRWRDSGWEPDLIMVCGLSPIYNGFVRRLRKQPNCPKLVIYLADSTTLGITVPRLKRLRHRLKPFVWPDEEMVGYFNGCVATSRSTEPIFAGRSVPWLWLPNGCDERRVIRGVRPADGPISFGYFGSLAGHTGLPALLKVFTSHSRCNPLHICGYGKSKMPIAELCQRHDGLRFQSGLTPDECLRFAQRCDVLVNPRPLWPGNDCNFSSKVFEYALAGRSILTSRVSGVDLVLGDAAFYFDEHDFDRSLEEMLAHVAAVPREELCRRGELIQGRVVKEFSWPKQGGRLTRFLNHLLAHDFAEQCR